jgi:5-methylcytosine-specific restriction endonuclease McrA
MISEQLKPKVNEFLSTLRVGVDFGETAGGIALVQGNRILHAETFVDFHDSTLETRRTLRRGRRTRRSKKMRLARLRSWVLRQKLPDGSHLPDPYPIMWDERFQTKPLLYKEKGRDPRQVDGWLEAAKKGEVDAAGFVCALTILFQKRGYKYDEAELEEFKDTRLLEFLNSCSRLEAAPDLAEKMRSEVERRGKPKLQQAFEAALTRPPEPRKAVPRQVKEEDLRVIVFAFGRRILLSEEEIARWQHELCGLLNRTLREPRFDNRMRSGCSWCGKNTPRLKKPEVREKAYLAAVGNLRVLANEHSKATRPLNQEERERFVQWWKRKQASQAGQHEFSKGAKVSPFDRTPSKDNLEKAFALINVSKVWLREKSGKPYLGYPMINQVYDLLNRTPRAGRASLCMQHLNHAASGGNMSTAGVNWQQLKVRRAPNPCREQHDERVLRRLERLLFVRGRSGKDAWRYGPVSFITLELPEPDTERPQKGQLTQPRTESLRERLHRETGGLCIYTGTEVSVEEMTKDHIVPDSKGGPDIRLNLVCACRTANDEKGNRLPSEWLGYGTERWKTFETLVSGMKDLPEGKKALLRLPPGSDFPEDPTPLAHVGARPRAFVTSLRMLFEKYGVEPPKMDYQREGLPHVQRVGGRWTQTLRMSWMWKDQDAKVSNFDSKDRSDLGNHAQDAALLAATPPHTWRSQILAENAIRFCAKKDGDGKIVRDERGNVQRELRQRPGIALLDLAPDWQEFKAASTKPITTVIGKLRPRWKRQLVDQIFYNDPQTTDDSSLRIRKPIEDFTGEQRRQTVAVPKGGLVIQIPYYDPRSRKRRLRKVQVKPISSTAAIFWTDGKKLQISLERPKAIHGFVPEAIDPPIPPGAETLGRWERGALIRLPARGTFSEGFYRVKELAKNQIIMIAENSITAEMARRMDLSEVEEVAERKLAKTELRQLFEGKSPDSKTLTATSSD